jgi:hypothetical protein
LGGGVEVDAREADVLVCEKINDFNFFQFLSFCLFFTVFTFFFTFPFFLSFFLASFLPFLLLLLLLFFVLFQPPHPRRTHAVTTMSSQDGSTHCDLLPHHSAGTTEI